MTWIPGLAGGGGGGVGPAQLHDLSYGAVGLWQFDGDLTDASATGEDLSVDVGTERYGDAAVPGLKALHLNGSTRLFSASPAAAALRIAGNMTWEGLIYPTDYDPSQDPVPFSCSGPASSELQADNYLYRTEFSVVPDTNQPQAHWERGAGGNEFFTANFSISPNRWHHLAVTRDTSGGVGATVARYYANGTQVAVDSTLDPPDGGTNARIWVGGISVAGFFFTGYLSSWKVIPSILTPAQVLAEARRTLPPNVRP